jgi:flavin-dependent dehydrogenase
LPPPWTPASLSLFAGKKGRSGRMPFAKMGWKPLFWSRQWGPPHSDQIFALDFLFSGRGQGWHLDRKRFDAMLAEAACAAGTTVLTRTCVRESSYDDRVWRIQAECAGGPPRTLTARFLIDASGRSASIARRQSARTEAIDRLVGIVGYVEFDSGVRAGDGTTLVESVPDGWWYSAWLPDNILAVAFMSDGDLIHALEAESIGGWTKLLSGTVHTRQRVVGGRRPVRLFPRNAASHFLRPGGGDGWLAAGDALCAFDPLSSLGIGHALASGAHAARAVEGSLRGDSEPFAEYIAKSTEHFSDYLRIRSRYYAMEGRWPWRPFWQRRHEPLQY